MKRTLPLLITAAGGFVLIFAFFIPATETWGEAAAIWFDILAAIAFILGGGNLLKVHLKKVSDRQAGWGYSGVTILAFLFTLCVGLLKVGVQPAANQEHYGESFVPLPLAALPTYSVDGALPRKADDAPLPPSVRAQLSEQDGRLMFRGWMRDNQKQDLIQFQDELEWQCAVERLAQAAALPDVLQGKLIYYAEHDSLGFAGYMNEADEEALRALLPDAAARPAVDALAAAARRELTLPADSTPSGLAIPADSSDVVSVTNGGLSVRGPVSPALRDRLARQWPHYPVARALPEAERQAFREELEQLGQPLNADQTAVLERVLGTGWTGEQLRAVLNTAGTAQPEPKSACQLLSEKEAGVTDLQPTSPAGDSVSINDAQLAILEQFAADASMSIAVVIEQLSAAGPLSGAQAAALQMFVSKLPTVGERNRDLCFELLGAGRLTREQADYLLRDYRQQHAWDRTCGRLMMAAHVTKHPWSGEYNQQGSTFWWLYEYVFQPLTATMFALLAFYVASAAFRAFRAKNVEAILLLGTAFIILLGRTFAGVQLTSWLPEELAGLRVENLTITIMSVFNTAGNRAIMIGIALGIASTSLKVLLGVDRSYLGSGDE